MKELDASSLCTLLPKKLRSWHSELCAHPQQSAKSDNFAAISSLNLVAFLCCQVIAIAIKMTKAAQKIETPTITGFIMAFLLLIDVSR
jgi:hypothetical protein